MKRRVPQTRESPFLLILAGLAANGQLFVLLSAESAAAAAASKVTIVCCCCCRENGNKCAHSQHKYNANLGSFFFRGFSQQDDSVIAECFVDSGGNIAFPKI